MHQFKGCLDWGFTVAVPLVFYLYIYIYASKLVDTCWLCVILLTSPIISSCPLRPLYHTSCVLMMFEHQPVSLKSCLGPNPAMFQPAFGGILQIVPTVETLINTLCSSSQKVERKASTWYSKRGMEQVHSCHIKHWNFSDGVRKANHLCQPGQPLSGFWWCTTVFGSFQSLQVVSTLHCFSTTTTNKHNTKRSIRCPPSGCCAYLVCVYIYIYDV